MRGFYVQTLSALLNAEAAKPPLMNITREPAGAQGQFDFCWRTAETRHAVQVKSSKSAFSASDVKSWAEKLQAINALNMFFGLEWQRISPNFTSAIKLMRL